MKRKWICMVVLVAVILAGCNTVAPEQTNEPPAELYDIYLYSGSEAEGVFTMDADTFVFPETDSDASFDYPPQIILKISGVPITMDYQKIEANMRTYLAEDGLSSCQIDARNRALISMTIRDKSLMRDFIYWDEVLYKLSATEIISDYYYEEWSDHSISFSTSMTLQGEDPSTVHTVEGFVAEENDSQKINSRNLEFTHVIDGVATTDKIDVRFTVNETNMLQISFSKHAFDAVEHLSVDTPRVDVSVDSFLKTKVDTANYTLQGYTLSNPIVTRIGDQLYYSVIAEMTLGSKNGGGQFATVATLLTDLEAEVSSAPETLPVRPYQTIEAPFTAPTSPVQQNMKVPAEWLYSQNENFEAFIYNGGQPEFAAETPIDLSGLTQGRLYLYSRKENRCIEVADEPINGGTAFLLTDERIYFVLESDPKTIRQADLTGQELEPFCTGFSGESILYLCYYGTNATDGTMIFNDNYKRYVVYKANMGFKVPNYPEWFRPWVGNIYLDFGELYTQVSLVCETESSISVSGAPNVFANISNDDLWKNVT